MRFFCITQESLHETNLALSDACDRLGVDVVMVSPDSYTVSPDLVPQPGDLMYRAATDAPSDRLEKLLWQPGVATFYDEPFFECLYQGVLFQRSGIPMPRTIQALSADRATLERQVAQLGGFPLVIKQPGGEGGQGVIRVDGFAALFSLIDYLGPSPLLMEYFEHVVAYRLIVVGDRVVATEARYSGPGDFRTNAIGGGTLGSVEPSACAVDMALKAAKLARVEFGGVDLLEDQTGRLVLAELNFPCYFAGQQKDSGIDIAGAMIEHLLVKQRGSRPMYGNSMGEPHDLPSQSAPVATNVQWRPWGR